VRALGTGKDDAVWSVSGADLLQRRVEVPLQWFIRLSVSSSEKPEGYLDLTGAQEI